MKSLRRANAGDGSQPYQLFAPLDADAYEALKADIAERGILVPIEVDEDGRVLVAASETDANRHAAECTSPDAQS